MSTKSDTKREINPYTALDLAVGEYDDVTSDWYQADVTSLRQGFNREGIEFLEYTLMRKALGDAANGLLVGLGLWGSAQAFQVLKAWLPAREGRKVRIKFKDGTEIEATTVHELEEIRDKFLANAPDEDVGDK